MIRHIVLFRVYDDVADEDIAGALSELRALGPLLDATTWHVTLSDDRRKGRVIVEDASFSSEEAFQRFQRDSRHARVAEQMAEISDWWVGDYRL